MAFNKCFFECDLPDNLFFNILDTNILFLDQKILDIFKILKQKKIKGYCSNIMIFTNNNDQNISWIN